MKSEHDVIYSPSIFSSEIKNTSPTASLKRSGSIPKSKKKGHIFSADSEIYIENTIVYKLFNQLPQEYQDEIDKKISEQMRIIEDEKYPTEMYISGDRYQGQKEDDLPHGWGIYWWANSERYEGIYLFSKFI